MFIPAEICSTDDYKRRYTEVTRTIMKSSTYPENLLNTHITCLPVDYIVKRIVHSSQMENGSNGRIYHSPKPEMFVSFQDIVDAVQGM